MNRIEIHHKVINHFGIRNQLEKAIEEIKELIVEIDKDYKSITAMTSEIADVKNMSEQLDIITIILQDLNNINEKEVEETQNEKMNRTLNLITK